MDINRNNCLVESFLIYVETINIPTATMQNSLIVRQGMQKNNNGNIFREESISLCVDLVEDNAPEFLSGFDIRDCNAHTETKETYLLMMAGNPLL